MAQGTKVERMYGQEGFTQKPEVKAILDKYEPKERYGVSNDGGMGGTVKWDAMPQEDLSRLMELLPDSQRQDAQNSGPIMAWFATVEVPGLYFHGYRVVASREDERITVEGFYCPVSAGKVMLRLLLKTKPNEWDIIQHPKLGRVYRAWWD